MDEIENTDAGERLGDDMSEDGGGGTGVHGKEFAEDIVELGQTVDNNEDVGDLQLLRIPEDHPR